MKTIKKIVLVVVFMLVTLTNYANSLENHSREFNAKKVSIVFKNVKKGHLLTVKNQAGIILHSEKLERTGLVKKVFDFSSLSNGKYIVELNKDFEIIIKSFEVKKGLVFYNKSSEKRIFKPVIKSDENYLLVSKLNLDNDPVAITLYYENTVIYTETLTGDEFLERIYKLDESITGNYKAVIKNKNRTYIKDFKF